MSRAISTTALESDLVPTPAVQENPFVNEVPGVCGGYPVVRGSRTPVRVVEVFRQAAGDLERTAAHFPHLTREQVRGALDFYIMCPERVNEDIERNARTLAELQGR